MNVEDLSTLLDFHYWARDRMFAALDALTPEQYARALGGSFSSIRDTVAHTYLAEWVWYSRWTGHSPSAFPSADGLPDLAGVRSAWQSLEQQVRLLVADLDPRELERVFEYRAFTGQATRSVFWHMVQHVVNHATYHRGQITTMLRQLGAAPPRSQDLIAFYRERAAR